jgi:hypothetical protein
MRTLGRLVLVAPSAHGRDPVQRRAYALVPYRKVGRVAGNLRNTVIHTYPHVSQFWKHDPDELLEQPVYSRDVPPCRHC